MQPLDEGDDNEGDNADEDDDDFSSRPVCDLVRHVLARQGSGRVHAYRSKIERIAEYGGAPADGPREWVWNPDYPDDRNEPCGQSCCSRNK